MPFFSKLKKKNRNKYTKNKTNEILIKQLKQQQINRKIESLPNRKLEILFKQDDINPNIKKKIKNEINRRMPRKNSALNLVSSYANYEKVKNNPYITRFSMPNLFKRMKPTGKIVKIEHKNSGTLYTIRAKGETMNYFNRRLFIPKNKKSPFIPIGPPGHYSTLPIYNQNIKKGLIHLITLLKQNYTP